MKPDPKIDPLTLQRLVDGELENEQVQRLLVDANSAPEQWQEIALGFVENQTWQAAFESQIGQTHDAPLSHPTANPLGLADSIPSSAWVSKKATITPTRRRSPSPWWVMAASLLVAGMIGYMVSEIQNRTVPTTTNTLVENELPSLDSPLVKTQPSPQATLPQLTPSSLTPAYHLEVPDNNEQFRNFAVDDANARVPIYRVGSEQQLKQFQQTRQNESTLPQEFLIKLSKSGYQIEQEVELISGQLGDGESFVVPVRTIRIVVGQ